MFYKTAATPLDDIERTLARYEPDPQYPHDRYIKIAIEEAVAATRGGNMDPPRRAARSTGAHRDEEGVRSRGLTCAPSFSMASRSARASCWPSRPGAARC